MSDTDVTPTGTSARLRWATDGLALAHPDLSAKRRVSNRQGLFLAVVGVVVVLAFVFRPLLAGTVAMGAMIFLYAGMLGLRIDMMLRAGSSQREVVPDDMARALADDRLPTFSVLVPAYREPEVMPTLVSNLAALDYPTDKLQVLLLLEADDDETITAAEALDLPAWFRIILIPPSEPRTKPKALNYALLEATGDIVTIYDAEDRPEPLQLRRVAVAFTRHGPEVACVQAELAYFNADENIITRWFTTEYKVWFTYFLPGLSRVDAPIPLGGTSNHIRRDVLVGMGGWDPYNVTEDADLGIRLRRRGYRVAVLDSVTLEEANTDFVNWVKQRSRWYKGYAQTWLVHMRHPWTLLREVGLGGFLRFNLFVGGTPLLALLNPVTWMLLVTWFVMQPQFIRDIMPPPIYYAGLFGWVVGNFLFYYLNLAAAFELGIRKVFRAALALPLYWVMMSLAAAKAFWQLVVNPAFWEKTQHGLSRHRTTTEPASAA